MSDINMQSFEVLENLNYYLKQKGLNRSLLNHTSKSTWGTFMRNLARRKHQKPAVKLAYFISQKRPHIIKEVRYLCNHTCHSKWRLLKNSQLFNLLTNLNMFYIFGISIKSF